MNWFEKIIDLLHELPNRPRAGKPTKAAVWVKNDKGTIAVTCSECLRTFPVLNAIRGVNEAECDFCSSLIRFEIIGEHKGSDTRGWKQDRDLEDRVLPINRN
jgi:hypothetical protein